MWIPICLKLQNFRSFVDQEYNFHQGESYLIQGTNNFDEGAVSNGSGKSSLREALCYCIGLPTYSERDSDLINNDANYCEVSFSAKNSITNQKLEIIRKTPLKGSSSVIILINDEDQKDKAATTLDKNKLIFEILGVSKEDLQNHYIISKEKFVSFFKGTDNDKKNLIARLSNTDKINGVSDLVNVDVDKISQKIRAKENELNQLIGRQELLKSDLEEEKRKDFAAIKTEAISKLEKSVTVYELGILEEHKLIDIHKKTVSDKNIEIKEGEAKLTVLSDQRKALGKVDYKKEISDIEDSKLKLSNQRNNIDKTIQTIQSEISECNIFKSEVEVAIGGAIKCPKCLHEFNPGQEMDIEQARLTLPAIEEQIVELENNITSKKEEINVLRSQNNTFQEKIEGFESKIRLFRQNVTKIEESINSENISISKIKAKIKSLCYDQQTSLDKIQAHENRIIDLQQEIKSIREQEIKSKETEIQGKINNTELEIEAKSNEINVLTAEMKDVDNWNTRFTKFKSHLANKSLSTIEGYTNMYIQKMRSNLGLKLEGFKINKDGSIKEKITPIILRDGQIEGSGSYKKYSGGERGKIDFSIILALQNLINNSCETGGLDLLWTDEITEGIDSKGVESIVESVSDIGRTCLITSHVTHEKGYDKILSIVKENKISKIVN